MCDEKIIIEVNPRTKEKKKIDLLDYKIEEDFTVKDLINQHKEALKEIDNLNFKIDKLILTIINLQKSLQVQIIDIKEDIK